MATDHDKEEPFTTRRAESVDAEGVANLVKRQTEAIFGRLNPDEVIEKANLAITLVNEQEKLLAFAAFDDHPSVDRISWEKWIESTYDCPSGVSANTLNSLFLRLFVAQDGYSQGALTEILKTVFIAVPLLQYIFLCPYSTPDQTLSLHFTQLFPISEEEEEKEEQEGDVPLLYVANRHEHYPMLHVRSAKPEDNDDLLPIIQQYSSNQLTEQYGDYFIAELVESQDKDHQTIVAEVNGRAVGFISVTTDVNVGLLWDHYQLESYHGLRKPSPDDVIATNVATKLSDSSHVTSGSSVHSSKPAGTPLPPEKVSVASIADVATSTPPVEEKLGQSSMVISEGGDSIATEAPKTSYLLCGSSNALSVQLFSISEQYEMRSIDLLPAVFQLFPDFDFLIMTLPSDLQHFPLLSHFTRVNPREGSTLNQELYILHKCSLLHSLKVRPLEREDVTGVEALVTSLTPEKNILQDINHFVKAKRDPLDENGTPIHAFVVELLEQIAGIVILREEEDLHYLTSHYNIEDFVYLSQHSPQEHMHLHHFLINPIFAPHTKHILKDTMRLSNSNNLYYPLPTGSPYSLSHSFTLALQEMVPVRPRRQIIYPNDLGANAPMTNVGKQKPNVALYHTNRKLSLESKISINTRIVFVGASDTTLACLESLVFSPHLKFNNLILVSPQGLSCDSNVLSESCSFFDEALLKIGFEAWITVVPGTLQAIDRKQHCITVETSHYKNCLLYYDYLVLSTGVQYALEPPQEGSFPAHSTNIITLNGDITDDKVMKATSEILQEGDSKAVVYGSTIDAYCAVKHLIEDLAIPGTKITLVLPSSTSCFKNKTISDMIHNTMRLAGVTVIEDYTLHRYFTDTCNEIRAIELVQYDEEDEAEYITVSCKVMFCLETQRVNAQAFKAINDACLVFDGRLVIDPNNFTNDPKILGAGPLTKYSRYYRTPWSHKYFNSHEVGDKLAQTILSKVDPTHNQIKQEDNTDLIPVHHQPKELYASLPGHYYYLHIDKPQTVATAKKDDKGQCISTSTDNGFFELYINQYHRIETITVLSNKPFEVSNYRCLYNQHEQYLNNLLTRWNNRLITDLFSYFREQWACAVFHDRFTDFLKEIEHLLYEGEGSVREKVTEIIQDSSVVSLRGNEEKIAAVYASCNMESSLHKRLHHYLLYNHNHLPMYAQQDMI